MPTTFGNPEMQNMDDPPTFALRWIADLMNLWGLCAKSACRRARACRGEPRDCLRRYAPLVPEEAREGVKALLEGQINALDFDTVREEHPDEVEAAIEWRQLVEQAARPA